MKFTLGKTPNIWWPVTVTMPDPEIPGKTVQSTLTVLVVPEGQDAFLATQEEIGAITGMRARARAEREYLAKRFANWDWPDMLGEDRLPVTFTPENAEMALQEAWFRSGLWAALSEVSLGQAARLGN